MDGMILIDKPQSFTSFDVVAVMRGLFHQKKVGHTGTLDPMATGVLPILLGKATRCAPFLEDTNKEYQAQFQLGTATDTQDSTGNVVAVSASAVSRRNFTAAAYVLSSTEGRAKTLRVGKTRDRSRAGKASCYYFQM